MFIFFFIVLLSLPAVMIIIGSIWGKHPPKTINMVYGYRTASSMRSQETWEFAHRYLGRIWLYLGIFMCIISVVLMIAFRNYSNNSLSIIVIVIITFQLIILCLPILPTEIALKNNFDEDGNRKSI